jgi:hypothetical protein
MEHDASCSPDEWNEDIQAFFNEHDEVRALSEKEARAEYLQELESLPIYGSTVYHVTRNFDTSPEDVVLAVTQRGIDLYKPDAAEPFDGYELRDLLRWGYVPKSTFYISVRRWSLEVVNEVPTCVSTKCGVKCLQVKSEGGKNHVFATLLGSDICETMTAYAFGWLKHAEIMKERAKRAALAGR